MSENIVWSDGYVSREQFEKKNGHKGCVLWFTGLSGSGKSTIATALEQLLFELKTQVFVLDGDNVRHGLNKDLGFTEEGRKENIRRISEVANLFKESGSITLTAFISPYRADREQARGVIGESDFLEVFIDTPLETCIERDPKGLYKKAINKEIPNFTGITDPYEEPENPALHITTENKSVEECAQEIVNKLKVKEII